MGSGRERPAVASSLFHVHPTPVPRESREGALVVRIPVRGFVTIPNPTGQASG